jgi:hypothetical protein
VSRLSAIVLLTSCPRAGTVINPTINAKTNVPTLINLSISKSFHSAFLSKTFALPRAQTSLLRRRHFILELATLCRRKATVVLDKIELT